MYFLEALLEIINVEIELDFNHNFRLILENWKQTKFGVNPSNKVIVSEFL